MARLVNREILDAFRAALSEWHSSGFVVWMRRPAEWLRQNFEDEDIRSMTRLMFEHIENGGQIDQVVERREIWRDRHEFHYDFRIQVGNRKTYIETVLSVTNTGPTVTIVSMHDE